MQHIGVRRESELGEPIADFDAGKSIDLRIVEEAPDTSACLRFIDPYGTLIINQLQLPVLLTEFENMSQSSSDSVFKENIARLVNFLKESEGTHIYVRFIGD